MNYLAKICYVALLGQISLFRTFWQKSHLSETKSHFFPLFQMPSLFIILLNRVSNKMGYNKNKQLYSNDKNVEG